MPDPSAVCAACSLLLAGLSRVAEISAPAHSISKRPSPNAHTQRWLQGVDKVSVRAEVEDELEQREAAGEATEFHGVLRGSTRS